MSTENIELTGRISIPRPADYTDDDLLVLVPHLESVVRNALKQVMGSKPAHDAVCFEEVPPAPNRCQCCDCGPQVNGVCRVCNGSPCEQCGLWMHPTSTPADYDTESFCTPACADKWAAAQQAAAIDRHLAARPLGDEVPL